MRPTLGGPGDVGRDRVAVVAADGDVVGSYVSRVVDQAGRHCSGDQGLCVLEPLRTAQQSGRDEGILGRGRRGCNCGECGEPFPVEGLATAAYRLPPFKSGPMWANWAGMRGGLRMRGACSKGVGRLGEILLFRSFPFISAHSGRISGLPGRLRGGASNGAIGVSVAAEFSTSLPFPVISCRWCRCFCLLAIFDFDDKSGQIRRLSFLGG